jgi:hypothetical protein
MIFKVVLCFKCNILHRPWSVHSKVLYARIALNNRITNCRVYSIVCLTLMLKSYRKNIRQIMSVFLGIAEMFKCMYKLQGHLTELS